MSQWQTRIVAIEVLAPTSVALDIPSNIEIGYDLVSGALSYSNMGSYLPGRVVRVMIDVAQNQAMVSYEGPPTGSQLVLILPTTVIVT